MWHYLNTSPLLFETSLLAISLLAGIFGSILGLGGGVIIVPVLTLFYGVNIHYAIGASIISVIATSSAAAAAYVRDHLSNIRLAIFLEVATTAGALCGAIASSFISPNFILFIFSLILFYSAFVMFKKKQDHAVNTDASDTWATKLNLHSSYQDQSSGKVISYMVTNVRLGFFLMLGAGVISGLLGIGSGVLKVPAMDSAMSLPIKVSSATSSFMIGVTAAASAGAYYMRGDILPQLAGPVALGVLIGSWIGAILMNKMHPKRIRKFFILVLLFIASQMLFKSLGIKIP